MQNSENSRALSGLINPGMLAELRRIELRTRRSIDADLMGRYRSAFRGTGLIYTDLREYQAGDDVKHIHWKVTARSGKVYVKSYEEDRQLNIILALDISRSTGFGALKSKHQKALEFCALLSLLAKSNQDAIGLCLFSDKVKDFLPARRSRTQIQRVLLELLKFRELEPATNLSEALSYLSSYQRQKSIIFIISDFISKPYQQELKTLSAKHDVICVMLEDSLDSELPSAGLVEFADAESGETILLDTSSSKVIETLKSLHEARLKEWTDICKAARADCMKISDNTLRPLTQLMNTRASRLY